MKKTLQNGYVAIRIPGTHKLKFEKNPKAAAAILRMRQLDRQVLADCIEDERPDLAQKLRDGSST